MTGVQGQGDGAARCTESHECPSATHKPGCKWWTDDDAGRLVTAPTPPPADGGARGSETEGLAAIIHPHMKGVRDRGDYMVGPASDEAATAILASDWLADLLAEARAEALRDAADEMPAFHSPVGTRNWLRARADSITATEGES